MRNANEPIDASIYTFAIVVSEFHHDITERLLAGAKRCLAHHRAPEADVFSVPGAFELPLAAQLTAETERYDAVICLGCVIRGETAHFEYVAGEAARGIGEAARQTGIPISFGVLTSDTEQQAEARAGDDHDNKGWEAARTAIEMAAFVSSLPEEPE
ncbi:MAG TPA: 6,7-dimethyl-8-ribityllumazine synthase [Actinomycetota bacterium]